MAVVDVDAMPLLTPMPLFLVLLVLLPLLLLAWVNPVNFQFLLGVQISSSSSLLMLLLLLLLPEEFMDRNERDDLVRDVQRTVPTRVFVIVTP